MQTVKLFSPVAESGNGLEAVFKNPNTIRLPMDMILVSGPMAARAELP